MRQKSSLFSKASRPALRPSQNRIQVISRHFPQGESGRSVKLPTHLPLHAHITTPPTRICGVHRGNFTELNSVTWDHFMWRSYGILALSNCCAVWYTDIWEEPDAFDRVCWFHLQGENRFLWYAGTCQNTRLSCALKIVATNRSEPADETTERRDHRGRPRTRVLVIRFL